MTALVDLSMYDMPEIRAATDDWWRSIARALRRHAFEDLPESLSRDHDQHALGHSPNLLLTQTCGFPLMHGFRDALTAVSVPTYSADGCGPGTYRSPIIVRESGPAEHLEDLRGRTVAANAPDSQSGSNALHALVAPLNQDGRFFGEVVWTGAHAASLAAVQTGTADVAAADCVTWALLQQHTPDICRGLRVLAWTDAAPALPYATRSRQRRIRLPVCEVRYRTQCRIPMRRHCRDTLLIRGLEPIEDSAYEPIAAMARSAADAGYPSLN